jgi:hypothetical protein
MGLGVGEACVGRSPFWGFVWNGQYLGVVGQRV